jgi:hypothetical protein
MPQIRLFMKNYFLLFIAALMLLSCSKDPILSPGYNFLPLKKGDELKFRRVGIATSFPFTNKDSLIDFSDYSGKNINSRDTVLWKYENDTVVDGKTYARIFDKEMNEVLFRKEKGVYYSLIDMDSPQAEVIILKDNLKEGDTWINSFSFSGGQWNENYKVIFLKKELTVDGRLYKNVIGIRYDVGGQTTITYYSDGIGEIYSYREYPLSLRYEHNKYYLIE